MVLEISKYRVKLDEVKGELCINEKQLEETQTDFNDASARLARMETVNYLFIFRVHFLISHMYFKIKYVINFILGY